MQDDPPQNGQPDHPDFEAWPGVDMPGKGAGKAGKGGAKGGKAGPGGNWGDNPFAWAHPQEWPGGDWMNEDSEMYTDGIELG